MPLAVEWVILVTATLPLAARAVTVRRATLAILALFAALISSFMAAFLALAVACQSVYLLWLDLSSNPATNGSVERTLLAVGASFGPWLLLAAAGITIAIVNQRLEPQLRLARELAPRLSPLFKTIGEFEGTRLVSIQNSALISFTTRVEGKSVIVVSSGAAEILNAAELKAVLWHELGHIRLGHHWLKLIAQTLVAIAPRLVAARVALDWLHDLCELAADDFAARRVSRDLLAETRALFD